MGGIASSEISSSQLVAKKLKEFKALAEMNKEIHSVVNINQLLRILIEKAVVGVNFERSLIYLLEDDYLRCIAWIDRVKRDKASIIEKRVGFHIDENAVEVLATKMGKSIYVHHALEDKRVSKKFSRISDTREYCVVPLIGQKKILGVLTGDKFYSMKPILQEDIETLELFAGHISLAIENVMLYEEMDKFNKSLEKTVEERTSELAEANQQLSRKMTELSTLYEMSKLLNKSLEYKAILDKISSMVGRLGYDICSMMMLIDGKFELVLLKGLDDEYRKYANSQLRGKAFDDISGSCNSLVINEFGSEQVHPDFRDYCLKKRIHSFIMVPIVTKGVLIGILNIYSQIPNIFKHEKKGFFSAFGQQVGVALENAIMFQKIVAEKNHVKTISKKIEQENVYLKERIKSYFVIGRSAKMRNVMDLVRKVAPTSTTVIIYGKTGTGKELIANAIHEMGPRKDAPLVKVNCAAIPDDLLESELFGHERGAFTGAYKKRVGMFELAQNGTIFLDEVGDLTSKTQTKLLRVLQEREIQPLGSETILNVDVRIIAATNKNLKKRIEKNSFRSDLFYRLNVFPINLPLLRERKEDIQELVSFFLDKYAHIRMNKATLDKEAFDVIFSYPWPGNIRELENVIERLMIISKNELITKDDLPGELLKESYEGAIIPGKPLREAVLEFKMGMVTQVLAKAGGKKSRAAEMLGLPRSNFSRLLKNLGM